MVGCRMATQRHGVRAVRTTTTAISSAQPTCRLGMAANWLATVAVVVVRTARTPWRWVAILHPTITVLVVVATANHYWVDAIAAALLLLVAIAVTPQPYAPSPVAAWWSGRRRARAVPAPAGRNLLAAPVGIPKPAGADDRAANTRLDADGETDPDRGRVFAGCPRPRPPVD